MSRYARLFYSHWRVACALVLCVLMFGTNPTAQQNANLVTDTAPPVVATKKSSARFKLDVKSQAEFDALARVYNDTPYPLPHMMFVIDRRQRDKVYYVNSRRYRFHREFVNSNYLSLERGADFQENYHNPKRRFILGTIAYQTPVKRWTFEFWEGDTLGTELIQLAHARLNRTFFQSVAFKPNSATQEESASKLVDLPRVLQSEITSAQEYVALNVARGLGRIHVIDKLDDTVEIGSNEIIVLNEVPITLPPVAGVIISKPSTPLSHVNLLAKGWGVPNAYIKNAHEIFRANDGWWMEFETKPDGYTLKRAGIDALKEYTDRQQEIRVRMTPRGDLAVKRLASLREQRKGMITAYGAKSANLGEVASARLPGVVVPEGWALPFFYYDDFMKEHGFDVRLVEMLDNNEFVHNPPYRRAALTKFRADIQAATINPEVAAAIVRRWRTVNNSRGVFVRSSSNTEDLPNFSGAGLYDTVPNVKDERALVEAIKTVWASLWKFEAYEARERALVDHTKVYMAVLVQDGINSESSGVMITVDPFDADNKGATYISAKRGLGIRVVEGKRVAEQLLYYPRARAVKVLSRSDEDSLLEFDDAVAGGVREVALTGDRKVLTDAVTRQLANAATRIKKIFGGAEQDIEWALMRGQIYILQSRPYITGN